MTVIPFYPATVRHQQWDDTDMMEQASVMLLCLLECHHLATPDNVGACLQKLDGFRQMVTGEGPRDGLTQACNALHDVLAYEVAGHDLADVIHWDLPAIRDQYFNVDALWRDYHNG